QVKEVLSGLSAADAALITLTMFEHYSPAQVAEALGITDGAARTRLSRARSRMAEVLVASENSENVAATKETSQ
ncbi:MAG TPA: sigma factor-like helix-turn-helix DNA-binding protein, partial [Acidimicrobiales bacterium]|nr:sigma factor-like helix-turn-helix DNA-binding protein [Acidimicrobiales bacterium]